MDDIIRYPSGIPGRDIVGAGLIGIVAQRSAGTVVKFAADRSHQDFIDVERRVYERLQGCAGILQYHGQWDHGIVLEYAVNDSIRAYQASHGRQSLQMRLRLAQELTAAVATVHSKGILHGDLSSNNAFLDHDLHLKLGDFAGSAIDDEPALVGYQTTHTLPGHSLLSVESDLFALGSTLYEIISGSSPFDGRSEALIEAAYRQNQFPDVEDLEALGDVITGCWQQRYRNADEVSLDIQAEGDHSTRPSSFHYAS